jgi:hypothetical protein
VFLLGAMPTVYAVRWAVQPLWKSNGASTGLFAAGFSMHLFVAFGAQRDQVLFLIAPRVATEFEVVYLQVLHAATDLAAPAVSLQYLPVKFAVAVWAESQSRVLS